MPAQTVTPTSAAAGSMLNVAGTIAGSNGATPEGTLTVTVSSPFHQCLWDVPDCCKRNMCGNQLSVLSTCPFPSWGFVAGCCSFVCGVLPCHVPMLCSQLPSAVQNSDTSGTLK